jgi:ABC-2 type transport system permease protein
MSRQITTLLKKDLVLFTRDRFYFLITILGIVMYIIMYFVMPKTLEETLKLGFYAPGISELENIDETLALEEGIDLKVFESVDELREAIKKNEYSSGIVLPENFMGMLANGEKPSVTLYFSTSAPEELKIAVTTMVNEMASMAANQEVLLEMQTEVLGQDMAGNQIPWRNRLIPALLIFILGTEVMSLASLIATELEQRTIRALLVTPLKLNQLLTEKALLGITMAFIQVALFSIIVGAFTHQPLIMIMVLLAGCILVTGLGFLVASLARDLMGVTAWGMIVMIIFVIPAIGGIIPGLLSDWAKIIPSYHLTNAISQLVNYRAGFEAVSTNILIMLGWSVVFGIIGVLTLRRRYIWASGN